MMAVALYLAAIVGANLLIAWGGLAVVYPVGFALIGATIVLRDVLHDRWDARDQLAVRMALLIATGGALSAVLNPGAGRIALASLAAFLVSEGADALIYQRLRSQPWAVRSNASNVASATLDSAVFIGLAFGWQAAPIALQAAVKLAGGALWVALLSGRMQRAAA